MKDKIIEIMDRHEHLFVDGFNFEGVKIETIDGVQNFTNFYFDNTKGHMRRYRYNHETEILEYNGREEADGENNIKRFDIDDNLVFTYTFQVIDGERKTFTRSDNKLYHFQHIDPIDESKVPDSFSSEQIGGWSIVGQDTFVYIYGSRFYPTWFEHEQRFQLEGYRNKNV